MNLDKYPFLVMYSFKTSWMFCACRASNEKYKKPYFSLGPFKNVYLQIRESEKNSPNNTEYLV